MLVVTSQDAEFNDRLVTNLYLCWTLQFSLNHQQDLMSLLGTLVLFLKLAEREGFEPPRAIKTLTVFETAPFNHSGTSDKVPYPLPDKSLSDSAECIVSPSFRHCAQIDTKYCLQRTKPKCFSIISLYQKLQP